MNVLMRRLRPSLRPVINKHKYVRVSSNMNKEVVNPDGLTRFPSLGSPNGVLRGLDWIGTVSFAASGCITAGFASMDILGCTIVGTITSIGGGTIRDLLIGNAPVFWVSEVEYILLCLATTGITFFTWNELEKQKIIEEDGSLLWWTDTIGVGAFCVIGAQNGIRKGLNPIICILCGMFTATFGGVIRDVLCQRKPRILHSNAEIYATTALTGAGAYVFSKYIGLNPFFRIFNGVSTAMFARYYASSHDIKLPLAPWYIAKNN